MLDVDGLLDVCGLFNARARIRCRVHSICTPLRTVRRMLRAKASPSSLRTRGWGQTRSFSVSADDCNTPGRFRDASVFFLGLIHVHNADGPAAAPAAHG